MNEPGIDLGAEAARVRGELISFRDTCLPAFFAPGGIADLPLQWPGIPARLAWDKYRQATEQLIDALHTGGDAEWLDSEAFGFLHKKSEPSYTIEDGRIVWRCGRGEKEWLDAIADHCLNMMGLPDSSVQSLVDQLPEVERWILSRGVDDFILYDALCIALPLLVDPAREFVRRALAPETWRGLVLDQHELTPREQAEKLRWIEGDVFRNVLNNALLHVIGSAANNHFDLILDLLDHPVLLGGYTDMFPHYIFGVLHAKIVALQRLAMEVDGGEGDLRRGYLRVVTDEEAGEREGDVW